MPLEEVLKNSGVNYTVYDKTQPNPTVKNVEEALQLYRDNNCNALIAIGGGSSMDCAKAVGAKIAYPKKAVGQMKGILRVLRKLPTLIAIPTTAGTGSEVTLAAIITDSEKQYKYALMSFPLIPHYAVLDASLTYSLPPHLTSTTGMDALTHAVEAYIGRSTTKETRQLAKAAVKLIFENVEAAYTEGNNHKAKICFTPPTKQGLHFQNHMWDIFTRLRTPWVVSTVHLTVLPMLSLCPMCWNPMANVLIKSCINSGSLQEFQMKVIRAE